MKHSTKNIVKNIIEENVIGFKQNTSITLNEKIANRLKQKYVDIAKKLFTEAVSTGTNIAMGSGVQASASAETAAVDEPLGLPPGPPISREAPPIPRGPNGEQGMTIEEFVKQYYKKKDDFDSREQWLEWLQEYYRQLVDLMQQWDREWQWRRRNNRLENRPRPIRIPTWKQFKQKEVQQPMPRRWYTDKPV